MTKKIIQALVAMLLVAVLAGCENTAGNGAGKESTEPPATSEAMTPTAEKTETGAAGNLSSDTYAPGGLDGATVMVKPLGKALISVVGGYPVRIYQGAAPGEYSQARLTPGDYVLHVGSLGAPQGLNLNFSGKAGDYFALALTYAVDGDLFWTPIIVSGAPNGPIVADKDGLLVGKTQAEAVKLLNASSNQPVLVEQAESEAGAKQKKAEEEAQRKKAEQEAEAKAKALFEEGLKAFGENRMDDALRALDESLMIAPNFDSALVLRGVTLGRLKQPESALESLDKAIRIGRNNRGVDDEWLHWPWLEKGKILLVTRKPDLAHEAFSESIRVKPTVKALIARANLSFTQGQVLGKKDDWDGAAPFFKSAQADVEKGLEIDPKSVKLWGVKTGTHIMLNEHEQACTAMRKACELGNCSILEQYPQCKPGGS
jgi:tetratricopeptide (TPR) repeat protein